MIFRDRKPRLIRLKPGGYYIGKRDVVVETILGSCVSVCLFSKEFRMGAINHALLPAGPKRLDPREIGRYMDSSLEHLLAHFTKNAIPFLSLSAIIIGGAKMYNHNPKALPTYAVGAKNVEQASAIMVMHGIKIIAQLTGGTQGKKIQFIPLTGEIRWQKIFSPIPNADTISRDNWLGLPADAAII